MLFYLDRISLLDINSSLKKPLARYFSDHVHVTPVGIDSQRYLRWCEEVLGADRLMHATDYPYNGAGDFDAKAFVRNSHLSSEASSHSDRATGTGSRRRSDAADGGHPDSAVADAKDAQAHSNPIGLEYVDASKWCNAAYSADERGGRTGCLAT